MNTNNEFGLIIRAMPTMYINIMNTFDNNENVIEINGNKHNLTIQQFADLKNIIENNLTDLIKTSKEQTPSYLNENGLDGRGKNINIFIGGISIYVDFAVANNQTKELGSNLIDAITKLFL